MNRFSLSAHVAAIALSWAVATAWGQPASPAEKVVYRNDFEKVIELDVWSMTNTAVSPLEKRRFLGEFEWNNTVSARLAKLPEHRFVRVKCDLLMLKTVDGDGTALSNPDTFCIRVEGGPLLLATTFSNPGRRDGNDNAERGQCFPDEYPFFRHPRCAGALEVVDLGFGGAGAHNNDAVFRLDLIFPHVGPELTLAFDGTLAEPPNNESWGLDNVEISIVSHANSLGEEQLKTRWKAFVGKEPVAASKALWEFIGAGPEAAAFVEAQWKLMLEAEQDRAKEGAGKVAVEFDQALKDLNNEEFKIRRKAKEALEGLGPEVLPLVGKAMERAGDPETRVALKVLKNRLERKKVDAKASTHHALIESRVNHVRRIWDCHRRGYVVTSSADGTNAHFSSAGAANDGFVPLRSSDFRVPRVDWRPGAGGSEWLQYEFGRPSTFSSAAVFWYFDPKPDRAGPPESWKVLYRDDKSQWKPVETKDSYGLAPDRFNEVSFKPITTTALRLTLQSAKKHPPALLEFRALPDAK